MKNFPVIHDDGKTYWVSRSVAVVVIVTKIIDNTPCVLVETRGKGAADNHGKKCFICGYIDYDETLEQAACREALEETGIILDENKLHFLSINSRPDENLQNISVRYSYNCTNGENFDITRAVGGEEDEVSKVEWLPIDKANPEEFCFGHGNMLDLAMNETLRGL